MTFDITKELQKTFEQATLQHEARSLRQPEDWQRRAEIYRETAQRLDHANERFSSEYDARIASVVKRLIHEGGRFKLDHPAPNGVDRFNGDDITKRAEAEVKTDHANVLQQIENQGDAAFEALKQQAQHRDLPHGKARDDFGQASDRREGPDRRRTR